jgi:hypothetical protein
VCLYTGGSYLLGLQRRDEVRLRGPTQISRDILRGEERVVLGW